VTGEPEEIQLHRALLHANAVEKWRRGEAEQTEIAEEPLSAFQEALAGLAHLLNKKAHGKVHTAPIQTEREAAVHIHESLARFLER
jgi:hypothetical protein